MSTFDLNTDSQENYAGDRVTFSISKRNKEISSMNIRISTGGQSKQIVGLTSLNDEVVRQEAVDLLAELESAINYVKELLEKEE